MNMPLMINSFDPAHAEGLSPVVEKLLERRTRVLGPSYKLFYERPVHVVRSEGVWLYDEEGASYLDVYNNVPSVGHCHPAVVEAVTRQMGVLNTHTRYLYDIVLTYAEKLLATFPSELSNVMFTCTGSESSDLAVRVAKRYTGAQGIIVTANGYHGITAAIAEMSPSLGNGVPLGNHVRSVPAPDAYRSGGRDVGECFGQAVEAAIADLARHGIRPAALMTDTIFSSDGVFSDPPGFLQRGVEAVRAAGGLFIADEVQPGFARTGDAMWGFQRHGIVPDLVTMGKPMGNGLPIGGVVARPHLLAEFAQDARYFNTFGGNPVCCAAANAVLDVIQNEGLMAHAARVGAFLQKGLRELAAIYPQIGDVRGAGLFIGAEFVKDPATREPHADLALHVVNRLRDRKVLISASSPFGNVLKIRPPLPFTEKNATYFLEVLADVMADARKLGHAL
jgi:4-aminobutyrate aminotransferase-like enzyme